MKSSPNLFNFVSFLLSSLVANPSFMSIPSLVLELRQFLFVRDSPEIRKSEEPPSEFCPISGDWGEWRIPNLAWALFIKCYWILQNGRVVAFTVSELLRANQQWGKITPHPPRLKLTDIQRSMSMLLDTRFHIWLIMTLYYKMWQLFYYKMRQKFILQNATVITNCDSTLKMLILLQKHKMKNKRCWCLFRGTKLDGCFLNEYWGSNLLREQFIKLLLEWLVFKLFLIGQMLSWVATLRLKILIITTCYGLMDQAINNTSS